VNLLSFANLRPVRDLTENWVRSATFFSRRGSRSAAIQLAALRRWPESCIFVHPRAS
jgi:hypothetical protein